MESYIKEIKLTLLGIALMVFTVTLHLFLEDGLMADFIALVGLFLVVSSYSIKKNNRKIALFKL